MTIARLRQPTKINAMGTNFILHSMRIVSGPAICAYRFRPLPSGVPEELLDETGGMNGSYVGAAPQKWLPGPSGLHTLWFDGSANMIDLYSSRLNTLLDGDEFSISFWCKVYESAQWKNSTKQVLLYLAVDGSNYIEVSKSTSDDVIDFKYAGGGTADSEAVSTLTDGESPATFFHVGFSVSDTGDSFFSYFDGSPGSEQTGIGTFSGSLDSDLCCVGSSATATPADLWHGQISDLIIWDRILTADEFKLLANVP